MPRYVASSVIFSLILLCTGAHAQPYAVKDQGEVQILPECPIDFKTRVGNPNTLGRFQSLSGCGAYLTANTGDAPPPQPIPQGTAVVRIMGVKEQPKATKKASVNARKHKVTVVPPAFDREIRTVAASYQIDPLFLHALIDAESGYKPMARSRVGALGLMQIMPATGAGLGVQPSALLNPAANLDAGARHLKHLQKRYGRNLDLILGAYNAGAGAVERYGNKVPPFAETQAYVAKVMSRYGALRASMTGTLLSLAR